MVMNQVTALFTRRYKCMFFWTWQNGLSRNCVSSSSTRLGGWNIGNMLHRTSYKRSKEKCQERLNYRLFKKVLDGLFIFYCGANVFIFLMHLYLLTHLFPMHPFSSPWKHRKIVRFSDVSEARERMHWEQMG